MENESWRDFTAVRLISIIDIVISIFGTLLVLFVFLSLSSEYGTEYGWFLVLILALAMYLVQFIMSIKLINSHKKSEEEPNELIGFAKKWIISSIVIFLFASFKFGYILLRTEANILWLLFFVEVIFRIAGIFYTIEFHDDMQLFSYSLASKKKNNKEVEEN